VASEGSSSPAASKAATPARVAIRISSSPRCSRTSSSASVASSRACQTTSAAR
jgi:hypothetical protein